MSIVDEIEKIKRQLSNQKTETAYSYINYYLSLPGLRGFWPMSAFSDTGAALDQSGNVRTLTYNGNISYSYTGVAPFSGFDGTGDYLSRADEAGLDILGTETYVDTAVRGMSIGGWFYLTVSTTQSPMGKWDTNSQRSYRLVSDGTNMLFQLSSNGTATTTATGPAHGTSEWIFIAGVYEPSTSMTVYVNGTSVEFTTSIPASIFSSTATFAIGSSFATGASLNAITGRASLCFLCTAMISESMVSSLFQSTRGLFRV